jgi:hypothetical protein
MLSKQESENISEIENILNKDNQYISIAIGEKKLLRFVTTKKIIEIEKPYNGQQFKKVRFIAIELNSGSNAEKFLYVGRRSARLIVAKLKEAHTILNIERIGSGKDTLYIPTVGAIQ